MNKQKEQEFKFRCERLAKKITLKADIIFTEIRYTELISEIYSRGVICCCTYPSDRRMSSSEIKFGFKNRIQVTLIGCGVGVQKFDSSRRNSINRILKTNAKIEKIDKTMSDQIAITFNVNPHKM